MANDYDDDYGRGRYGRDYYDDPYRRIQSDYEEPYYEGYGGEPSRHIYGRGDRYYRGLYRSRHPGGPYGEPYGRYEYVGRAREPYYHRYEDWRREPYYRWYGRGAEDIGYFERAVDEVRPWLGGEDIGRRRMELMRVGTYAGRGPRGYRRSDERIREDINDRLTDDWYIDASDIEVTVNNGMVTLTGRVDSRREKRRAEDIAESVSGVTDVSNQLRIGRNATIEPESGPVEGPRARTART
ncbi:MAG TPA: BON domain-containing protein [Blastocatellia bacterium]